MGGGDHQGAGSSLYLYPPAQSECSPSKQTRPHTDRSTFPDMSASAVLASAVFPHLHGWMARCCPIHTSLAQPARCDRRRGAGMTRYRGAGAPGAGN
eukprot:329230-Hanusia_phi.AAC.1